MILLVILVMAVALSALAAIWAGMVAERALRLARLERRSDHWRRLGEAAQDVENAALSYQRAMGASLDRHAGNGQAAGREREVRESAERYREASRRLARVLAAGPRPPRCHQALALLLDQRSPEIVAASRPAEAVLGEVVDLQDTLDLETRRDERPDVVWSLRARARVALIALRGNHRRTSR